MPVGGEKENHRRWIEKVRIFDDLILINEIQFPNFQVEFNPVEQLLLVMVGPTKERHVRLVPSAALDGRDLKWIKVDFSGKNANFSYRKNNPFSIYFSTLQVDEPKFLNYFSNFQVADTKGCHLMAMGSGAHGSNTNFFAVAIKKSVVVFQIDRKEKRHDKWMVSSKSRFS